MEGRTWPTASLGRRVRPQGLPWPGRVRDPPAGGRHAVRGQHALPQGKGGAGVACPLRGRSRTLRPARDALQGGHRPRRDARGGVPHLVTRRAAQHPQMGRRAALGPRVVGRGAGQPRPARPLAGRCSHPCSRWDSRAPEEDAQPRAQDRDAQDSLLLAAARAPPAHQRRGSDRGPGRTPITARAAPDEEGAHDGRDQLGDQGARSRATEVAPGRGAQGLTACLLFACKARPAPPQETRFTPTLAGLFRRGMERD